MTTRDGNESSESELPHDGPRFQFQLVDAFTLIAYIAAVMGLWQFQRQVNPVTGQGLSDASWFAVHAMRFVWNAVFIANLLLIVQTRFNTPECHGAIVQWRRLSLLSLPWLTYYSLILIGMSIGPESYRMLAPCFGACLIVTCVAALFLLAMFSMEAQSVHHRWLQLVALAGSLLCGTLTCLL